MTDPLHWLHRCRPAAGGNAAAALPPRAPAQPSGPVSPGLHHVLPGAHLPGQPAQPAPPLLGPPGAHPFLGQVCRPTPQCMALLSGPPVVFILRPLLACLSIEWPVQREYAESKSCRTTCALCTCSRWASCIVSSARSASALFAVSSMYSTIASTCYMLSHVFSILCSSGGCDLDWGAPMAWGWPFLLRLAGAHRRRPRRPQPPARSLLPAPPPPASLPATGPPMLLFRHVASFMDVLAAAVWPRACPCLDVCDG